MAVAPVFNVSGNTVSTAISLAAGQYNLQLTATQNGVSNSPFTGSVIPINVATAVGNVGVPTGLSSTSTTATSITVTFSPPADTSTLNNGSYLVEYKQNSSSTWLAGPQIPYCTRGSGSITDTFGNVWTVSNASPFPVRVNGVDANPTSAVTLLYLVAGAIWQQNTFGDYYSLIPSSNYGSTPPTNWSAGTTANPLVLTVTGLAINTDYNFRVSVSNTGGRGSPTAPITVRTGAQQPTGIQPPPQAVAVGYTNLVFFSDFVSASEVTKDLSGGTVALWYSQPTLNYTISNSVLTMRNTGTYNFNADIATCANGNAPLTTPSARRAGNGNGLRFKYGCFECMQKIDPNNIRGTGWIAWWARGFQHNVLGDHSKNSVELDFFEYFQTGGAGSSTGLWNWASSPITTVDTFATAGWGDSMYLASQATGNNAAGNFTDWFVVGGVVTPTKVEVYWNSKARRAQGIADTTIFRVDTTRTYPVNAGGQAVNAVFDAPNLCDLDLLIGGSSGSDYLIDYVAIWQ